MKGKVEGSRRAARKDEGGGAGPEAGDSARPFWKKPLDELSKKEWEALCDGCGRCCLVKLEDEDDGRIYFTSITCRLFDAHGCRCQDYAGRKQRVPDCVRLTLAKIAKISWLPPTCAYKLRAEGKDLPWWHYLQSGSRETVHQAGISVRGRTGPAEDDLPLADYADFIVRWPGLAPKGRRPRKRSGDPE